jgi:hypothetical protein
LRHAALLLGELTAVLLGFGVVAATSSATGDDPLPPEGWSVTLSEHYEPAGFVIAIRQGGGQDRIELLHPQTGEWMATICTSDGPMVVRRPTEGQLIVSDLKFVERGDGTFDRDERVLIFDMANGLALVREIPIEFRVGYKFYWPGGFVLSGGERYLFYLDHRQGEDSTCDETRWVAIDLDDPDAEHRRVITRGSCGWPFVPGPGDSIIASCPGPVVLSGAGEVVEAMPLHYGSGVPFRAADGTLGTISNSGRVTALHPNDERVSAQALPPDSELMRSYAAPGGRILLAYRTEGTFVNYLHGVALFDPEGLETVHHSGIEVASVAPRLDGGGVWALRHDGTIASLSWTARVREWELNNEPLFDPARDGDYEWESWSLIP